MDAQRSTNITIIKIPIMTHNAIIAATLKQYVSIKLLYFFLLYSFHDIKVFLKLPCAVSRKSGSGSAFVWSTTVAVANNARHMDKLNNARRTQENT